MSMGNKFREANLLKLIAALSLVLAIVVVLFFAFPKQRNELLKDTPRSFRSMLCKLSNRNQSVCAGLLGAPREAPEFIRNVGPGENSNNNKESKQ